MLLFFDAPLKWALFSNFLQMYPRPLTQAMNFSQIDTLCASWIASFSATIPIKEGAIPILYPTILSSSIHQLPSGCL
jgi:hypothetical protein